MNKVPFPSPLSPKYVPSEYPSSKILDAHGQVEGSEDHWHGHFHCECCLYRLAVRYFTGTVFVFVHVLEFLGLWKKNLPSHAKAFLAHNRPNFQFSKLIAWCTALQRICNAFTFSSKHILILLQKRLTSYVLEQNVALSFICKMTTHICARVTN